MTRAERRRKERQEADDKAIYQMTGRQLKEMRANVKAELTKEYDAKLDEFKQQYESRIKDIMQVATNRSLIYVLGLGVEILTKKFGFNKKQNHKWFDEVRMRFNESPDLISQLVAIEQFSGWDLTPTLDEITFKEDTGNE